MGHGACGPSEWINGPPFSVATSFHPNAGGQFACAFAVGDQLIAAGG